MPTQYDNIGSAWSTINDLPYIQFTFANVRHVIEPLVRDGTARVLDLACGTGVYSRAVLSWGAKEVVGVDISDAMISVAKAGAAKEGLENCTFLVADGSKPAIYEGGRFDLVTGVFFLNYAKDVEQLTKMFATVSMNLKPGGTFFSAQPPRSEQPLDHIKNWNPVYAAKYGYSVELLKNAEHGCFVHVTVHTRQPIEFDCYWLRQSVFEPAARAGGMGGQLQWLKAILPDELTKSSADGFWDYFWRELNLGLLMVRKSSSY